MNDLLIFIAQTSIVFSLLYFFFHLFLRKLTFHKENRLLLLSLLPLSLVIPFLGSLVPSFQEAMVEIPVFEEISFSTPMIVKGTVTSPTTSISPISYLLWIYAAGVLFGLFRLFQSVLKLIRLRNNSEIHFKNGHQLILADIPAIFSCFHWIFVPKNDLKSYNAEIMAHEKAHVRMRHTLDLIITECYVVFFWVNPAVYFFRKSLKAIHEYQADQEVLREYGDKISYLKLLQIQVHKIHSTRLYSHFYHPILKKRIDMITKHNSTSKTGILYMVFIPLIALLSMAFNTAEPEQIVLPAMLETFTSNQDPILTLPIKKNTSQNITIGFGKTFEHPKDKKKVVHKGIDFRANKGVPIFAAANGTVANASLKDKWGNLIIVTHPNGYETYYAHLNNFVVKTGQLVKKGELIGYVGNTGVSTGPHLHFELRHHKKSIDPMPFFEEH